MSGDVLTFRAELVVASLAEYQGVCAQLRGMVGNRDENAFPLTSSVDPSLDGFYNEVEVDISPMPAQFVYSLPWAQVRCRRVLRSNRPAVELTGGTVVRTNSHGITAPAGVLVAVPVVTTIPPWEADFVERFTATAAGTEIKTDDRAGGTFPVQQYTATSPVALNAGRFFVPPSYFYAAAPTIEVDYGDGTYRPMVGAQISGVLSGSSRLWRLNNGTIRVRAGAIGGAAENGFEFEVFDGTNKVWEALDSFLVTNAGTALNVTQNGSFYAMPVVLENTSNRVSIAFYMQARTVTVTMRRGSRVLEVGCSSPATVQWGLKSSAVAAATAITGGIRRTSNDGSGNRWVYLAPNANTTDLVNGGIYTTTGVTSIMLGVGAEFDGSGATAPNTATDLRDTFYGASYITQRVVVR
jgi:hypothetical protein